MHRQSHYICFERSNHKNIHDFFTFNWSKECHQMRSQKLTALADKVHYVSLCEIEKVHSMGIFNFASKLGHFWGRQRGHDFSWCSLRIFDLPVVKL